MSKKSRKAREGIVINTETTGKPIDKVKTESKTVDTTSIEKTHNTVTLNLKRLYEKVKFSFLVSAIIQCVNGLTFDVQFMYSKVIEFILTQFTFKTDTVYLVSRKTYLNIMCKLFDLSPTMSKKSNKMENATITVYGDDVQGFINVFDVDKHYTRVCMVAHDCFVHDGINIVYVNGNVLFMHHDIFTKFQNGEMLNDTTVQVIDIDYNLIPSFKPQCIIVRDDEIEPSDGEVTEMTAME